MKQITKEWLSFAEADLITCKKVVNDAFLTNIVSFHSHQTIEKCFKAVIEEKKINIPRIHSLIRLFSKIENIVDFEIDEELLKKTDKIYTETRYPSDMGMFPDGKPSLNQAKELYKFAIDIFQKTTIFLKKL